MKIQFKIQPFQTESARSIVEVFAGQPNAGIAKYRRDVGKTGAQRTAEQYDPDFEFAYRNAHVQLESKQILENIHKVQTGNNLKHSASITEGLGVVSLDVEMETGSGKTYCYIKTMFELNKHYGWRKFIVVVPSVAIREGVKKTFEMTQDHFMELYGEKVRFFVYDSSNLHQLDEFSQSAAINVMIINMQAFNTTLNEDKSGSRGNQAARIIYSKRDEFGSRRPIDVIKANNPIIILDEPQKMGGAKTQEALKKNFDPLFSLNYSATHKTAHNLVYVLDALDAFKQKIVKKIEVKGFDLHNLQGTNGYMYLAGIRISPTREPLARLEIEVKQKSGIKRTVKHLATTDNLFTASSGLGQYKGITITEIDPLRGQVTFSNGDVLKAGMASGDVNEKDIRRIQIRETIDSHFDKEEKLFALGIKCLSLFFIDEVAKYRQYGEDGEEVPGEYGRIFEEEYKAALDERRSVFPSNYQDYLKDIEASRTHRGYFSIDKKGHSVNSDVKRGSEFSDDISAYDLILKDKERLLSFEEPTRFIFSHSALREGWDNPNVFQICTLKHSDNATAKRQEVGRGLRLCVNKYGVRQDAEELGEAQVHGINTLTVVASESYAGFVGDLQKEIKADLYDRPTTASIAYFANKTVAIGDRTHTFTEDEARAAYNYLVRNDYVDDDGAVTDIYREALKTATLAPVPDKIKDVAEGVHSMVQAIYDPSQLTGLIEDGHNTNIDKNPVVDENWKKFQELWERINSRYAYVAEFDSEELIRNSVKAIDAQLNVAGLTYTITQGEQRETEFDVQSNKTKELQRHQGSAVPYDLIGQIAKEAVLTRRAAAAILKGISPKKRALFQVNPEAFISKVVKMIIEEKASVVVESIRYEPSAEPPYTQEIFNENINTMKFSDAFKAKRAIQEYVVTDGTAEKSVERNFAEALDTADEVIVYAKLPAGPRGFQIPTPVGNYSPDWAISLKQGAVKHIFFIAETKGSMNTMQLRGIEKTKIECAKKLFNNISTNDVKYHKVTNYQELLGFLGAEDNGRDKEQ